MKEISLSKASSIKNKSVNHLFGVFQTREFLLGAVTEFLKAGLHKNEGLILFVTPENSIFLKEHFALALPDYADVVSKKQIHFLDVNQAIAFFYLGHRVSEEKFNLLIGSSLATMKNHFSSIRVYSEMEMVVSYKSKDIAQKIKSCWKHYLADHDEVNVLCGFFIPPHSKEKLAIFEENELNLVQNKLELQSEKDHGSFQMKMLLDRQKQTQMNQVNSSVEELRKQLVQASKYRHMAELMSSISHSVINPVTIIHGNINILKMILKDENLNREEIIRNIESISDATSRIEKLSRNVIHSSLKVNSARKEKTTSREIIENVIDLTKPMLRESNITIEYAAEKESLYTKISIPELTQIILNLIINAKDAIQESRSLGSGKIKIKEVKLSSSMMQFEVDDNGSGIHSDFVSKIFTPFFTTRKDDRNGLGLFISQNILRGQGGKISFETKPGVGSTFKVLIPL